MPKVPKYAKICQKCQNIPKYAKTCQNMPKYAKICQNMPKVPKYAKICQNMPKFAKNAKTCQNLASPFLLMMGHLNQESMDRKAIYISRLLFIAAPPPASLLQPGYHSKALPVRNLKIKIKKQIRERKIFSLRILSRLPIPAKIIQCPQHKLRNFI